MASFVPHLVLSDYAIFLDGCTYPSTRNRVIGGVINGNFCKTGWGDGPPWDSDRKVLRSRYADMQYGRPTHLARLLYYADKILTGTALNTIIFQARWEKRPLSDFIKAM